MLLLEALAWVIFIRASLWLRPYQKLLKFCQTCSIGHAGEHAERVPRAVRRAARWIPGASCLTQALAAQVLLARRGVRSVLHLGVNLTPSGGFGAHAWIEIDSIVVMGGDQRSLKRYSRIISHETGPAAGAAAKPRIA
ncbi:lasso peptide biosynthesis B2 protein [Rhodobacteraceae bacterium MCCB 386]|nr:lasso peptide biosynthesis B2 protein [Roseitranquillus sediminis]